MAHAARWSGPWLPEIVKSGASRAAWRAATPRPLRALYDAARTRDLRRLLRVLGDRAAAEDVQQQVFLEAWQRADRFDPERGGLRTWLLTIARSRAHRPSAPARPRAA